MNRSNQAKMITVFEFLNGLFPMGSPFASKLAEMLEIKNFPNKTHLFQFEKRARKAWFLQKGIVIAQTCQRPEDGGEPKYFVNRIYTPGTIFTDLDSFFFDAGICVQFICAGEVQLQEISKQNYLVLEREFDHVEQLVRRIMRADQKLELQRSYILSMGELKRFRIFSQLYNINELPNLYGASYLDMDPSNYSKFKRRYNLGQLF